MNLRVRATAGPLSHTVIRIPFREHIYHWCMSGLMPHSITSSFPKTHTLSWLWDWTWAVLSSSDALTTVHLPNSYLFFLKKIYLFILKREGECGGGAEGERESQADSTLSTEPDMGLGLTTLRSWPGWKPRVGSSTNWATQVPLVQSVFPQELPLCTGQRQL